MLAFGVFMYTPGPGRRLWRWLLCQSERKALRTGLAVGAVRVVAGSQAGLGEGWYRGVAAASPGRLVFTRYVGGFSRFKRPVSPVQLIAIGSIERLRPIDSVRFGPDCDVFFVLTS